MKKSKIMTILLALCLTVGVAFNLTACGLFDKVKDNETASNIVGTDDSGNNLISGKVYAMSSAMTFTGITAAAATVTLQATIKPDNASDKSVDWSLEWVNPSSTWANGKDISAYMTVAATSDGSTTANVTCHQAFGEKIKIIVTSRINENATASCIVDYAGRFDTFVISAWSDYGWDEAGCDIPATGNEYTLQNVGKTRTGIKGDAYCDLRLEVSPVYGAHTKTDTVTRKCYIQYNQAYLNALTAQGFALKANASTKMEINYIDNPVYFGASVLNVTGTVLGNIQKMSGTDYNKLVSAAQTVGTNAFATMEIVATGAYSNVTRTISLKINPAIFAVSPTSIELNNSTLVV